MALKFDKDFKVDDKLKHIAFIMDGNGRWAKKRFLPRSVGHKFGVESMDRILRDCSDLGIKHITVYAFSTENWNRPKEEIDAIISLLLKYIEKAKKDRDDVRYIFIGDKSTLPTEIVEKMTFLEELTKERQLILNIAFNYGGRAEIVRACNKLISEGKKHISEEDISNNLYTSLSPDPDLIIRTAGEYRLSNFLLWQCAYSELYTTNVCWPDFNKKELLLAIENFYSRKRKFGGLNEDEV